MGKVYCVDGHDGSGKTSIATAAAEAMGVKYVHFYKNYRIKYSIDPLSIPVKKFITLTKNALENSLQQNHDMVLDRGLIVPLSVLPKENWDEFGEYFDKIPTVLCYSDVPTTVARLRSREVDESGWYDNAKWSRINTEIAKHFGVPIIDTSAEPSLNKNVETALKLFRCRIGSNPAEKERQL